MKTKFKSRNEVFGKTVFNTSTLQHSFMTNEQFNMFKKRYIVEEFDNKPFFKDVRILYSPIRSYFDITLKCNLRCQTCLNESGKPMENELKLDDAINVVEGLNKDYVFDVKFSGGEPTQKRGWFEIMSKAKELGLAITVNSNGIYDKKTIEKLINLRPNEITISLDGLKKHNDYIRGKGTFEKATKSIKKLSKNGLRVTINSVVTSIMDESDIKGLLELANEFCYDISFFHARPIGRAKQIKNKLLNAQELNEYMKKIDSMKSQYPLLKIETRSGSLRTNSIHSKYEDLGLMMGGSDGFTRLNIMPDGKIFAGGCVPYVNPEKNDNLVLGNIKDENFSLLNIWRHSERLWKIRKHSHFLKKRCDNCEDYQTKCSGFTLDMELYRKYSKENVNPYCKY